jgi:protein-S-isoprenylcysteine O-methyltransferase Ste14
MIRLGNFLFRYRNQLFPFVFALMALGQWLPLAENRQAQAWMLGLGFVISLVGQLVRILTIGLDYIKRGGKKKTVYAEKLVTTGIFAHCRNPMYLGNLMMIAGLGIIVGVPFFIVSYWAIILAEEHFLRGKFGEEYLRYCTEVSRLIPRLTGMCKTILGMRFHWKRLIVKEYQTIYIWGLGAVLFFMGYEYKTRKFVGGSAALLNGLYVVVAGWTVLFLAAWIMKKRRILRPD